MKEIVPTTEATQAITDNEAGSRIFMEGERDGVILRAAAMLCNQVSHLVASIDGHLAFVDSAPGRMFVAGLAAKSMHNTYNRVRYSPGRLDELELEADLAELREEDPREIEQPEE